MKLITFFIWLLPFAGFAQDSLNVYMEVLPGQNFKLINDSLFPPHVQLKGTGICTIPDSVYNVEVELKGDADTVLYSNTFNIDHPSLVINENTILIPFGQYSGVNQFTARAILKNASGGIIKVLTYSSIQ